MATRLLTRTLSSPKKLSRLSSQASLPVFKKKLVVVSYFGELLLWTTLASYFRELLWWATFVNYFGELVSWTTFVNYFGELLWQKDCASNKEDFKSSYNMEYTKATSNMIDLWGYFCSGTRYLQTGGGTFQGVEQDSTFLGWNKFALILSNITRSSKLKLNVHSAIKEHRFV